MIFGGLSQTFSSLGSAPLGSVGHGISFSASSIQNTSTVSTVVGTATKVGATGTPVWSLANNAGGKYAINSSTGVVTVASALSIGTDTIVIHATGLTPALPDKTVALIVWSTIANSVVPAITGNAIQGVTLTSSAGTWTGSPAPTVSYQWKRAGSAIGGATASTYVVQNADVGSAITVTATASNGYGSPATATSSGTAAVTKTTLAYSPVTTASIGVSYTGATPSTSGGTSSYVYSTSGALPTGLSVSATTGVILGTPTTSATFYGISLIVTDANGVTDTSSPFSIVVSAGGRVAQVQLAIYGQSNGMYMSQKSSSPPSANAGTSYFDGSVWGAVPAANGVRELLNGINTTTSKTVSALNGSQAGLQISALSKGTSPYTNFINQITNSGGILDFIVWYQGEGDSAQNTSESTYRALLTQLHSDIVSDIGTTKSACPLVLCGLATTTDPTGEGTDVTWDHMERTLINCGSGGTKIANVYYSHSNRDGVLDDDVHINAVSQGRNGKRFAKTICEVIAGTTNYPNWHIESSATVDATHTDVTFANDGLGTDFTPTTNPSGFELSGDNGSTWAAPSSSSRVSATVLRLTHSSLATTSVRKLRYQYGRNPNVSAPVLDNSSLALPLDNSAGNISPTPLAVLPVITYVNDFDSATTTETQTATGVTVPGGSESLLAIIGHTLCNGDFSYTSNGLTVTAQPSGTPITATLVANKNPINGANTPGAAIYQAVLPSGTTSIDISLVLSANPFGNGVFRVSTIPASDLSSTTSVGSGVSQAAATTTQSCTLATTSGGCVFVVGAHMYVSGGTTCSFTGTETYTLRNSYGAYGGYHSVGDASNVGTNASSTLTITYSDSSNTTVVGASWR